MFKKSLFAVLCYLFVFSFLVGCAQESNVSSDNTEQTEDTTQAQEVTNSSSEDAEKQAAQQIDGDFKVTLLGTGSPVISSERFSNSTLVEVAGQNLLFDVGRGSTIRLNQMGVSPGMIDKMFITHLHHDHTMGFDDLLITGAFVPDPRGIREQNFRSGDLKEQRAGLRTQSKHLKLILQFEIKLKALL